MKRKILYFFAVFGVIAALITACEFGTINNTIGGSSINLHAKKAGSPVARTNIRSIIDSIIEIFSSKAFANTIIDGEDFGDFPVDSFSIRVHHFICTNTKGGPARFGMDHDQNRAAVPIASQLKLATFNKDPGLNYCNMASTEFSLLYNGQRVATFFAIRFIEGEEFTMYNNTNRFSIPNSKPAQILLDKYPGAHMIAHEGGDFVVNGFDGIDLDQRKNIDLTIEWNISKLIHALKDAKDNTGDYNGVEDLSKSYIQDFLKSFSLKVNYE